jgi:REP element-mobilizing transposase RayT
MTRPLRIEFPSAIYHVTSRGNARGPIFKDEGDRLVFLGVLEQAIERFNWLCHAYCLMDNHYHLMIETPDANLTTGMRHLNGVYTQRFNRRHKRVGHVFQGRFKGILVERDSHLLELCRYVVLNPVRAKMTPRAGDYRWSSYRATAGMEKAPAFLTCDWVLSQFARTHAIAEQRYRQFVREGIKSESPWNRLRGQILLGSEAYIRKIQPLLARRGNLKEIPRVQRLVSRPPLKEALQLDRLDTKPKRDHAIQTAHLKHGYTLTEIGTHLGLHYTTISKVVNQERKGE